MRAKAFWSSTAAVSRSRSGPALASISSRKRVDQRLGAVGRRLRRSAARAPSGRGCRPSAARRGRPDWSRPLCSRCLLPGPPSGSRARRPAHWRRSPRSAPARSPSIDRAALRPTRAWSLAWAARVVVGQAQGHLVGQAADARGLRHRQVARRMRQDGAVAVEGGPLAGEHHLQVRRLGQRARRVRQRALEGFDGAFVVGHGTVVLARLPPGVKQQTRQVPAAPSIRCSPDCSKRFAPFPSGASSTILPPGEGDAHERR